MQFRRAAVPLGFAWSSPFSRWQGPLATMSSADLAVDVTARALAARGLPPAACTHWSFGTTVPQVHSFYGMTLVSRRLGAPDATGPAIAVECATSAACVQDAAAQVELGAHETALVLTTDRTSNGPLLTFPDPAAPGGAPATYHWVRDPMRLDPTTGQSMLDTAENVAAEAGFTRAELDEVTLLRHQQYRAALADDRAVQRRYLVGVQVPGPKGATTWVEEDAGVHPTTAEGLAKLSPARPGGLVTYGAQTHPADGTAGMVVTTVEHARALAGDRGVARILGSAFARAAAARMPKAPVPAAHRALADAGLTFADVDVVTTHNPFAVNDLWFSRETGIPLQRMNPYGCSLVYGHPQAPTGTRAIAELLVALEDRGGGYGLFTGCAGGDLAGAVVVQVTD